MSTRFCAHGFHERRTTIGAATGHALSHFTTRDIDLRVIWSPAVGNVAGTKTSRAHAKSIMLHHKLLRPLVSAALCSTLGIGLLGAANDAANTADTQFSQQAMQLLLQSVSNANPAEADGSDGVKALATNVQGDEVSIGSQLASIANYYGINVSTEAPKPSCTPADYATDQAKALSQLVALFQAEQQGGGGAQLRTFAADALPMLEKDLNAARHAQS